MPAKKTPVDPDEAFYLSLIPKQKSPPLEASKVSKVLRQVIQRRGYAAVQSADQLRVAWAENRRSSDNFNLATLNSPSAP